MNGGRKGPPDLWGGRPVPAQGETQRLDIGPLTLWLRSEDGELWITHGRAPGSEEPELALPADAQWGRWALPPGERHLHLSPVFPDRPLVVKPEHAFTLMRRASARIFMRVPVWVRVELADRTGGGRILLTEIHTVTLSETWWGDVRDGELAYWLVVRARRKLTPDLFEPHLVVCAVQSDNLSEDDLQVEKLALRVEHLSVYEKDGWLWGEEVRVEYHGDEDGTDIRMDDVPPPEAAGAREISPARVQGRSFKARTFARLRALSGWGG
ncbi:MAG: hypothetical protein FIA95_13685 [Gemmatimonadetes bacterium]|nr:hypothetical protein [Gemmatimonadota bacterium]